MLHPVLCGAGAKSAAKVKELLEGGFLSRNVTFSQNPEAQAEAAFCAVWGVGPTHAQEWVRRGLRTLEDLRRSPECLAMLTVRERAGLRHAEDLAQRIPREVRTHMHGLHACCTCAADFGDPPPMYQTPQHTALAYMHSTTSNVHTLAGVYYMHACIPHGRRSAMNE